MNIVKYIVLIALAFSFTSCKSFKKKKMFSKNVDTLLTQTNEEPEPVVVDTVELVTVVEEAEPVYIQEEPGVGYTSDKYYMIVGSFMSEKLATKYAQSVLDKGYKTQVIYSSSNGFYRVSASSFNDYQTAINGISQYRAEVSGSAWVHVKR